MINQFDECKITTWCCMSQGVCRLQGRFEKNIYDSTEKVKGDAIIDNKDCNIACTTVRLAIEQEICLKADGHVYKEMITLTKKEEPGVAANEPNPVYKFVEVDLNTIKFPEIESKTVRGVTKPYSPEDKYMMSRIQAAAHGSLVKNEYFIAIRTEFDGCTCCDTTPLARTPLQVVPTGNPACFGF